MGRKRKYATEAERSAARKAQMKAYYEAKRDGTWVRKNAVHSKRIAEKLGILTERQKKTAERQGLPTESRAAYEAALQELNARRAAKRVEREAKRQYVIEHYGFDPKAKGPLTPTEEEGRIRWRRDQIKAEYRRHLEKRRAYNRMYRERQRAAQLKARQRTWTSAEWAEWNRKQERKLCGPGTPAFLVKDVARILAEDSGVSVDDVMAKLLESGGVDFLMRGAEAYREKKNKTSHLTLAAARAVMFFVDPDNAIMFPKEIWKRKGREKGK